jgi:phenylacetate-CoA ligase
MNLSEQPASVSMTGGPTVRWAPPSLQSRGAYAWLYRNALSPFWEKVVRGRPTHDHLAFLEATQWLPEEEIEQIQLEMLKRLLVHAGEHVPYYRELFKKERFDPRAVSSRADLRSLPVLTKDIIRERYHDLIDPAYRGKNIKKGTSGSTGTPLKFEYSLESESFRRATRLRGYCWAGFKEGLPAFYYWAQISSPPSGLPGVKIRLDRALRREVFVDSMRQNEDTMLEAVYHFRRVRPHVIVGYTQAMAVWARFILERGLREWDDLPVICAAEAVLPGDRSVLSRAFGPAVFETYGARETMLIGAECPAHAGLHLAEENLLVEVVRDGKLAAPGENGDVLITDLHNYGMPFIRYVNGDLATFTPSSRCPCGRGLRRLSRVDGRRAEMLRDPRGEPIPGLLFHVLFSDARKEVIKQFQVIQRASGAVVLKVVRGQDFAEPDFAALVGRFGDYLRGLPLSIEFHEAIPEASTGKRKTVIVERL